MKKWMSKYWAVPGVAGLALAVSAVFLAFLATTPVARAQTATPTVTNTPSSHGNAEPRLRSSRDQGGQPRSGVGGGPRSPTRSRSRTMADENGELLTGLMSLTRLPSHTDCVSASVTDSNDLDFDDGDISDTCDDNDAVEWIGDGDLDDGRLGHPEDGGRA